MLALGRVRPAQGPRLRGDDPHLGRRRGPDRRPARVPRPPRPDHAALGGLAGAAARPGGACRSPRSRPGRRRAIRRWRTVAPETVDLLRWQRGPIHFHHHIPVGVHMLEFGTLLIIAYVIFRPLAAPRALPSPARAGGGLEPGPRPRHRHALVLQAPGDKHYLFSGDRRAFVGYRSRTGCCCSPATRSVRRTRSPGCSASCATFADARGLKLGALGASERLCPLYEELGLRTIYLGDEAIVDLGQLLARGPPDPQGAPVGHPPEQGRLHGRAARAARARPGHARAGRAGRRARPPGRARARLLDGDGLAPGRARPRDARGARARRRRRDPRRPALRALLRPPGGVAVVHAPRPGDAQRADRVPRGAGDRAAARARAAGAVAELRRVRQVDAQPGRGATSGCSGS